MANEIIKFWFLPIAEIGRQSANALPEKPGWQEQLGAWFTTRQSAFGPQVPAQGSTHFWLTHASLDRQFELRTHSGRHSGGFPTIFVRQAHWACPATTWHCEFNPHGGGLHGLGGRGEGVTVSPTGFRMAAKEINESVRENSKQSDRNK